MLESFSSFSPSSKTFYRNLASWSEMNRMNIKKTHRVLIVNRSSIFASFDGEICRLINFNIFSICDTAIQERKIFCIQLFKNFFFRCAEFKLFLIFLQKAFLSLFQSENSGNSFSCFFYSFSAFLFTLEYWRIIIKARELTAE